MPEFIKVADLAEIAGEFVERAHKIVWCNVATVDGHGRPRSRVMHPVWEGTTGWITTRRGSPKTRQLAQHPFVSLAYVADIANAVYADCAAQWVDDPHERARVWALIAGLAPPVGFDPAPMYISPDDPGFGLLKLTPWRIELSALPDARRVWGR
jgi:hypothetical protein